MLLKKAYGKYHNEGGKEKAAKYYQRNKQEIKKKERNKYKNMSEDEKNVIRERSKNRYHKNKQRLEEIMFKIYKRDILSKYNIKDEIVKYYVGYIVDDNVIPLVSLVPVMLGWIKDFGNGGKNMSFKIEDDEVYLRYNEIWKRIKEL